MLEEQLLGLDIRDRGIVLVKGTHHHPDGIGADGPGDPLAEQLVRSVANLAPVHGDEHDRFANAL